MFAETLSNISLANVHRPGCLASMPDDVDPFAIQKMSVTEIDSKEWAPNIPLAFVPSKRLKVHGFRRRLAELDDFLQM